MPGWLPRVRVEQEGRSQRPAAWNKSRAGEMESEPDYLESVEQESWNQSLTTWSKSRAGELESQLGWLLGIRE